jgi:hypothetical protein
MAVIDKFGGLTAVASQLEVSRQLLHLWQTKGAIPVKKVGAISQTLGISAFSLNYEVLCSIAAKPPTFNQVVKDLNFAKDIEKFILQD